MPEVYEKVEVTIERKELNACLRQLPPMSSSEEAIKNAVSQFLRDLSKVKVGRDTLKEISSRAAMDPIKSESELIKAFEVTSSLNGHAFIIRLDPVLIPMVSEVARGQGRSIAEVIADYISYSAANGGFFTEHLPFRHVLLDPKDWDRLCDDLGAKTIGSGADLVRLVSKLRKKVEKAEDAIV